MYKSRCMRRTQMYLTNAQRTRLSARARASGVSEGEVIRGILDDALGLHGDEDARLAAVDETAGLLADAPDWPDWLRPVRGRGAGHRLRELGLWSWSTRPCSSRICAGYQAP